jgi:hypothetical protein
MEDGLITYLFGAVITKLEKATGMNFVLNLRMQSIFFAIMIIVPVGLAGVRADARAATVSHPLRALQAAGLRVAALPLQGANAAANKQPDTQPASPAPEAARSRTTALVTYENGQLTIVAENVSLSEILAALHTAMGTEVDLPAGSSGERMWARLGPGPARKVLSELLRNTDLNFVIQGSPADAAGIQSVTMTLRTPEGGPGRSEPVESVADRRRLRSNPAPEPAPEQEASVSPAPPASATPPSETPAAAPVPPVATAAAASGATDPSVTLIPGPPNIAAETLLPSAGSFNPHPTPPATMTPDQMAQQLTIMYQQRRQMQQSQAASSPN